MKFSTYDGFGNLVSEEDTRTLAEALAEKNAMINALREQHLTDGMWLFGHYWATDARARANVTGVVASVIAGIPLPSNFTWRDNNNNNVPFDTQALVGLGGYLMMYVNQVYNYSWDLKLTLDALQTNEAVDAFDVISGWPDGNMDGTKP